MKREERTIISFVGRTNAGKSSLINLFSFQKEYAITDETPGTTADVVVVLMEIHDFGPVKLLDTAGIDEYSQLGEKKRKKTFEAIEEADLSLVTVDLLKAIKENDVTLETEIINHVKKHNKQILLIYNVFDKDETLTKEQIQEYKEIIDKKISLDIPSITLNATNQNDRSKLINFIEDNFIRDSRNIDLLPNLKEKGYVLLVVPMDEETPTLRLLRPQDMAVERLLRNFTDPVLHRPNLAKARSQNQEEVRQEKERFENLINDLKNSSQGLQLIITDSQAFDIIAHWVPKEIPLTSFSIMMTSYMSFGYLDLFMDGVKAVDNLKEGDNILIVEACNHNRKCDDIGTVQIPKILQKKIGGGLNFDFSFGRTYPDDIEKYKLIIHCGACMIDRQKFLRRILKAKEKNVPFTNYGVFLAHIQGKETLEKTVQPFLNHTYS